MSDHNLGRAKGRGQRAKVRNVLTRAIFLLKNTQSAAKRHTRPLPSAFRPLRSWRLVAGTLVLIGATACRQDMHDAPRYEPLEASTFFGDGRGSRTLVANTVARGTLREDEHLYAGKLDGQLADTFPMPVTADVMARGR